MFSCQGPKGGFGIRPSGVHIANSWLWCKSHNHFHFDHIIWINYKGILNVFACIFGEWQNILSGNCKKCKTIQFKEILFI